MGRSSGNQGLQIPKFYADQGKHGRRPVGFGMGIEISESRYDGECQSNSNVRLCNESMYASGVK